MMEFPFQKEELVSLDRDKLYRLASYYHLTIPKGLSKQEMVDFVWDQLSPKPELPDNSYNELREAGYVVTVSNGEVFIKDGAENINLSQMSSRLKRITINRLLKKEG